MSVLPRRLIASAADRVQLRLEQLKRRQHINYVRWQIESSTCKVAGDGESTVVIANAIPKSGTYLLKSIVSCLERWKSSSLHLDNVSLFRLNPSPPATVWNIGCEEAIRLLPNGHAVAAHLQWEEKVAGILRSTPRFKHVFQIRDLRDVCVSYLNFLRAYDRIQHPSTIRQAELMREFFSHEADQLAWVIPKILLEWNLEGYLGWLSDPSTHVLRFEDVYQELLQCPGLGFGRHLLGLFEFLGVDRGSIDPGIFSARVLGNGHTATTERAKTRQFERRFTEQHNRMIDNARFKGLMDAFGYAL